MKHSQVDKISVHSPPISLTFPNLNCMTKMLRRASSVYLRHARTRYIAHLSTRIDTGMQATQKTIRQVEKVSHREDVRKPQSIWRPSTVHEGVSWACVAPRSSLAHPREVSRDLRHRGEPEEALEALESAGLKHSRHDADLLELLLAQLNATRFKGYRERLDAMCDALWRSPTAKSRAAYAVVLTACAKETARVSNSNPGTRAFVMKRARAVWNALCTRGTPPDAATAIMLRVCGNCRALSDVREVFAIASTPTTEPVAAALLLALGKCGRSAEAEACYFSPTFAQHRAADAVLAALFHAHVASSRISRAEQLLAIHGVGFLTVRACNAFVRQCAMLQLHSVAHDFVGRMRSERDFPRPNAATYNHLLNALCAGSGSEHRAVAADRALALVDQMGSDGIAPTTVTYNTLIRTLILRSHVRDALQLYRRMQSPNRITFSHLMRGAADARDAVLARALLAELHKKRERPNYAFCKSYLETVAHVDGLDDAFRAARQLAHNYSHVLVFGDVGGREAVRMALIAACGKVNSLPHAFAALRYNLGPDTAGALAPLYTATVLMQVCIECGALGRALEIFNSLKQAEVHPNFEVYESLIYGMASHARLAATGINKFYESDDDVDVDDVDRPSHESHTVHDVQLSQLDLKRDNIQLDAVDTIAHAMHLVREMYLNGCARSSRQAAFMYNTLIAAAGCVGDFELALQIFNKMSSHTNPGVVYISKNDVQEAQTADTVFSSAFEFPKATIGTYNSMIDTAWRCGMPDYAFQVYDMLVADRINEPNAATYNLISEVALHAAHEDMDALNRLLKDLDRATFLPKEVAEKRVQLRQKVLALRWS